MSGFCQICPYHGGPESCKFEPSENDTHLIAGHSEIPARQVVSTVLKPGQMVHIRHGWAYSYRMLPNGERQLGGVYTDGDILCWPNIFSARTGCSSRAITKLSICVINVEEFNKRVRGNGRYFEFFQKLLERQFLSLTDRTFDLCHRTAEERLCRLLLKACLSLCGKIGNYMEPIPITQEILADLIGVSKVHVNRLLSDLRQRNVCHVSHGYLSILDWELLQEAANVTKAELEEWADILIPPGQLPPIQNADVV